MIKLFSANFSFLTANKSVTELMRRQFHVSLLSSDSIRDIHRQGTKISGMKQEVNEGTTGATTVTPVNLKHIDNRFPTAETLKTRFSGIPYTDLPIVYIKATKNNTLVSVFDRNNLAITYTSCRLEGFKNAKKKTNIAGQTTGVAAGQRLLRRGIQTVRVQVKGIGPGRMTCVKGLTVAGVNVASITDHTPLKELGPRPLYRDASAGSVAQQREIMPDII